MQSGTSAPVGVHCVAGLAHNPGMPTPAPDPGRLLTPAQMANAAEDAAFGKVTSPAMKSFMLGLTGGAWIAFAFVFYVTTQVGAEALPYGVAKLMGGFVFCTGLVLVVLTGSELFTSSTLTLMARASGRISWLQLLRNWLVVYVANFIGAVSVAALIYFGGVWTNADGGWGAALLGAASGKLGHTFLEAFCLGILCNLMVCAAVWMAYSGRTTTDKILAVIFPVSLFVAAGFEHSVANMFLIPLAIVVKNTAGAEFWAATGLDPGAFGNLAWDQFFLANLVPVTLGNIVGGGLMIGLFYWFIYRRPALPVANPETGARTS